MCLCVFFQGFYLNLYLIENDLKVKFGLEYDFDFEIDKVILDEW